MPYCSNCRTYIPDGVDTCPKCGIKNLRYVNMSQQVQTKVYGQYKKTEKSFFKLLKKAFMTEDLTYKFNSDDILANSNNAILAYLGPLVIIPLIFFRKSKFTMFHCCQGLMNTVFGIIYFTIVLLILNVLPGILIILLLIPFLLFATLFPVSLILGIVHALKRKAITLPLFGRINLMHILFKDF